MPIALRHRNHHCRAWPWVLAFALWLPAAQWAAATHTLLHLQASVAPQQEPPAHLPDGCDACVVAATLAAAAPAPAAAPPWPQPEPAAQPAATPAPCHRPAATPAYLSRAPPLHA